MFVCATIYQRVIYAFSHYGILNLFKSYGLKVWGLAIVGTIEKKGHALCNARACSNKNTRLIGTSFKITQEP